VNPLTIRHTRTAIVGHVTIPVITVNISLLVILQTIIIANAAAVLPIIILSDTIAVVPYIVIVSLLTSVETFEPLSPCSLAMLA
jgi:hypothetical protein